MTRAEIRDMLAKLSPATRARVSATTLAALLAPPANAPQSRQVAPYASKWEKEYSDRLRTLQLVGDVILFDYEPITLLAHGGTRYTPDFLVRFADGREEYHEVKGYLRPRDAVRMRECAAVSRLPILVFSKRKGAWTEVRRYLPQSSQPLTQPDPCLS